MVEHQPCITFGRAEKGESLKKSFAWLEQHGFELAEINRGGKITYHGPGQLVIYPIIPLKAFGLGVKSFVCALEKCMIEVCQHFSVKAKRKEGFPGAWVKDHQKIGSVGIHVRKMVSMHGFSLNINPNLQHFDVMMPCGLDGVRMTSIAQLSEAKVNFDQASKAVKGIFETIFECQLVLGDKKA